MNAHHMMLHTHWHPGAQAAGEETLIGACTALCWCRQSPELPGQLRIFFE